MENSQSKDKKFCITIMLPDGKHYFCGIGDMPLPGTTNKIEGNVWSLEKSECEKGGVFDTHREATFFNKKYIRPDNPKSRVERFKK